MRKNNSIPNHRFYSNLALGILLIALLLVPKMGNTYFNGTVKGMLLVGFAGLFFIANFKNFGKQEKFRPSDFCWLGLITWTGASIFWATNTNYALYGLFSTILVFLCYKVFESIEWNTATVVNFRWLLIFCIVSGLGYQTYNLRNNFFSNTPIIGDAEFIRQLGDVNHHWLGGMILLLLPFLLFAKAKQWRLFGLGLFFANLVLAMVAGSAFVTLLHFFLGLLFLIFSFKFSFKKLIHSLSLSLGLLLLFILITSFKNGDLKGISFILDEFYEQGDRFWMWKNSLQLFLDAPFLGVGKNNWEISVGHLGYIGCDYCTNDALTFNRFVHAHNAFFQIISELGLPGLACYLGIGGIPLWQIWKQRFNLSPLQLSATVSLLLFGLLCLMYGIVYNYYQHFQGLTIFAVFCLAMIPKPSKGIRISNFLSATIYVFLSCATLFYFYNLNASEKQYKINDQNLLTHQQLGLLEHHFSQALKYTDQSKVYEQMARLYKTMGYPKNSLAAYQKAIQQNPNNLWLHYDYGNLLYQNKQPSAAFEMTKKVRSHFPGFVHNQVLYIQCLYQLDRQEEVVGEAKILKKELMEEISWIKQKAGQRRLNDILRKKTHFINQLDQVILKKLPLIENLPEDFLSYPLITHETAAKLPKLLQSTAYHIDEVSGVLTTENQKIFHLKSDQDLVLRGWAIDTYAKVMTAGVFIELNDQWIRARYRKKRVDVAHAFENANYQNSGFLSVIPASILPKGEYEVKLWVLNEEATALFAPVATQTIEIIRD